MVKHPPKARGEWQPRGDLDDLYRLVRVGSASARAEEVPRPATEALGSGANHRLVISEQEDEQGLRAVVRDEPDDDPCGDEPPDVEETCPCLTLLAQLLGTFTGVGLGLRRLPRIHLPGTWVNGSMDVHQRSETTHNLSHGFVSY